MATTRKIVLDVLKAHEPNGVDFATALAELSPDYQVRLSVVEVDAKTESVIVVLEGENIAFDPVIELIEKMGASVHSIDEVEVHGSELVQSAEPLLQVQSPGDTVFFAAVPAEIDLSMIPEKGKQLFSLLYRGRKIARRYMVTNGFDGTLTMLGMMTGFYVSGTKELGVAINACLGATIALFVSGFSSAYLSEKAERQEELRELEQAMLVDLEKSHYGDASRYLPFLIASVNGLSPLFLSLLIIAPLFLAYHGIDLPCSPFLAAIAVALVCIFLLGVYLGKISRQFWLWAGLRTVFIALTLVVIILLFDI